MSRAPLVSPRLDAPAQRRAPAWAAALAALPMAVALALSPSDALAATGPSEAPAATRSADAPASGSLTILATHPSEGTRLQDALIVLRCDCLAEDQLRQTDGTGHASFDDLPAGEYSVDIFAGKAQVHREIEIPAATTHEMEVSADPARGPRTEFVDADRRPQPQYWGNGEPYGAHTDLHKAGVGLLVAGGVMTTGAILAASLSVCNKDGANEINCAKDTRTLVSAGFGSAAVALFASGGALVGVAKRRHRRDGDHALSVGGHAAPGRGGVVVRGKF